MEIIRVCPIKSALKRMGGGEKKFYSTIIIKFALSEVANKAVSCGIVFYRQNIVIKLYNRETRLR